jgi:signal transduction histidine kinase
MFREMSELKEFNETLVSTMLHSLMVVSRDGTVQIVNDRLSQTLRAPRSELLNRHVSEILGPAFERHELQKVLDTVTETGSSCEIPEVRVWSRGSAESGTRSDEFVFDLRLSRVFFRGQAHAVFLLINLTQRWRKTQQLQLMNEMGRFLQASLEVNTVLRTVLTCITAGPALGFNRAFLLLLSDDGTMLKGAMALGPSSAEEASIIWREMGRRALSLQEILSDETESSEVTPLQRDIAALQVPLDAAASPALAQSVRERRALKVSRSQFVAAPAITTSLEISSGTSTVEIDRTSEDATQPALNDAQRSAEFLQRTRAALSQIFTAPEAVVAPLVAKTRIVGVVVADNLYSGAPIEDDDVRLLETVAQQAGLTVDNALTYQALQKAQRELVSAERLVAVGEMAARVSHEIRNPLATIGGWARSILKKPQDSDGVRRKVSIIIDEVQRLEELLTDLLDMARPSGLLTSPCAVNEMVEHAILLAEADIKAAGVEVEKQFAPDIPLALLDRRRILQALLNTLRNGAQSMSKGGVLTVITRLQGDAKKWIVIEVRDTGAGIPERALKQVFDPFFSTKVSGSGLGLAVTLRIVRDHGGTIDVYSNEGKGTCFVMNLPLHVPPLELPAAKSEE